MKDHSSQNARLDLAVQHRLPAQPRFGIVCTFDRDLFESRPIEVWDHQTGAFHPIGELLAPLFAAVGLGAV